MKKKLLLTVSLLFLITPQITKTSDEEVVDPLINAANNIIFHLQELTAQFETASDGVEDLGKEMLEVFLEFDVRDWEYEQLSDCIKKTFEDLNDQLDTCHESLDKKKLESQLHANQISALEFEIKRQEGICGEQIATLEEKIRITEEKYATLGQFDEEKASELIAALEKMKKTYVRVMQDKNDTIANLRKLLARIQTYNIANKVGIEDLGSEICGDGFIVKLSKKNKKKNQEQE